MIKIKPTGEYPCQWDDLIDSKGNVIATVYTLKESGWKRPKIRKAEDGIYDIVVASEEINNEVVRNALKDLSKRTKKEYIFVTENTLEDKIIRYANKLMNVFEKYGDQKEIYDFSDIKTPKQKARLIRGWIGEILYEAMTYKDIQVIKSLISTIETKIKELIRQ